MRATRRTWAAAAAAVGLAAGAAAQQHGTICWFWTFEDTAGNTDRVHPGESALLTLWAGFDPPNHGFAQAGPYDIRGDAEWSAGSIDDFENLLFFQSGFGTLQADNSITDIHNFQLPQFFNPDYDNSNPIDLFTIQWTPNTYKWVFATLDNGAPDVQLFQVNAQLVIRGVTPDGRDRCRSSPRRRNDRFSISNRSP